MAKPPTFPPQQIEEVYAARDPRDRVKAFLRLAPSGVAPFELVLELAAVAGARSFRESYADGAPGGYVGFSGAVDLMAFLPEPERALSLLQGVSGARADGLRPAPNFAGFPWSHSLGHDASMDDMDSSIAELALPRFHGRLVPFVNEETRRKYGHRYLFTRSVLDAANDGQRHVVTGRGLRLADALRWRNSEECLYALSHYFLHAPTDYERAETLQVWLDGLGKDLPGDNRNRKAALPAAEADELEAMVFGESGKALFDRLLAVWMKGYSLEAIAEVLVLAAGARLAAGHMPEVAARRLLFLDASFAAFPWLRGHDGLVQVLMCALDLQRLGGADSPSSAAGAAAALAPSEPEQAVERLAREAAARDATAAEIGSLAVAPILLGQFRRSGSTRKAEHLGALAAWLARPATRELAAEWQRRG